MSTHTKSTWIFGSLLATFVIIIIGSIATSVSLKNGVDDSGVVSCNIAVVPLVGEITSFDGGNQTSYEFENLYGQVSADHVIAQIDAAVADSSIVGVLLRIDSGGGSGVGGEIIADSLKMLGIPNLALIRSVGTSAAYLSASGADAIIASRFSDIGGIGVNMSYLDNSQQNENNGVEYVQLTSALFKDYGNPNRALTDIEKSLFQRDLGIFHHAFVEEVAINRQLPIEKVEEYADGSSVPGEMALSMGLVDAIGDQEDARVWFAQQLDSTIEGIHFCE